MSRRSVHLLVCSLLVFAFPNFVLAKTPAVSDLQALSYAAQSIAAMTGGATISDVTLTGNSTWPSGSANETATATLYAKVLGESRVDLSLSGGRQSDARSVTNGVPAGSWTRNGSTPTAYAQHNCWTDAAWFFSRTFIAHSDLESEFHL